MINRRMFSVVMLSTASLIWGTSFVAQIMGMEFIGPFTFCAARYVVALFFLIPFALMMERRRTAESGGDPAVVSEWRGCLKCGILCGGALFIASSLQQVGLLFTTAGKAAFITAMYIVIVPVYGLLFMKKIPSKLTIFAIIFSTAGLYLLSIDEDLKIEAGDALILASALFWAAHIMICGRFAKDHDTVKLSTIQFGTVALFSAAAMFLMEAPEWGPLLASWQPILYAGLFCTGICYTLQMAAQRDVGPVTTCIILSAEALFAAVFGYLILGERLSGREMAGCAILLAATLMAQIQEIRSGMDAEIEA